MARRRRYYRRKRTSDFSERLVTFFGYGLVAAGFLYAVLSMFRALTSVGQFLLVFSLFLAGALYVGYVLHGRYRKLRARDLRYVTADSRKLYAYMDPQEFEEYVGWVFAKAGYEVEVTPYRKDHGIDIEMRKAGKRYAVQVKKYGLKRPIGEQEVRDFYGSIANLGYERGYFVTSGRFTREAFTWARPRSLTLMHGAELMERAERIRPDSVGTLWRKVLRRTP